MNANVMTDAAPAELAQALVARFGSRSVLAEPADTLRYRRDWHGDVEGSAVAVLRPADTAEASAMVRFCAEAGLAVVPQGGNTGLVLGALPTSARAHVVVSTERMNRIREIDAADFSAVVEAGCVLGAIKEAAEAQDLFFPLSLGAEGSCQIGGNISTNAGGINVLRYGMTREMILGLEVVLADGTVWNGLSTLRKNNAGLDLKQLFIGAEGTLGLVTAAAIRLVPKPTRTETAFLALGDRNDVMALYALARRECCDLLSAFELVPPEGMMLAKEADPSLVLPRIAEAPAYALIDVAATGSLDLKPLMERFFELAAERGYVVDGVLAASEAQAADLWQIRDGMNEGQARRGVHLRTDLSVPPSKVAAFIEEGMREMARHLPDCLPVAYGHVGDGNIHFNVLPPPGLAREERDAQMLLAKKTLHAIVDRYAGGISAEHGIGRLKRDDFATRRTPVQQQVLAGIKALLDPADLFNPGCQMASPRDGSDVTVF
ncbi:FAD-binding oxidoreductase [Aureimonas flava]|uniref:FAD-binding oxidoreductase n=1 Tax=Aureimonas flava TaxID=2320271 RepID=A0A3A1WMV6_9HYPH|nr:FAD-binding oxidoreductase [Aureimonas flava]RIY01867.1 FAD-binding oxidoreductase [Aureimonas flava]